MTEVILPATLRAGHGKGAARRLRSSGLVPGVVYSGGQQAVSISMTPKDLTKALLTPLRRNALILLDVEGKKRSVMLKDLQKDPIKRGPTHADFVELDLNKPVIVDVPFAITGRSKAVIAGGKTQVPMRALRVRVLPGQIPTEITLDTSDLGHGPHRASIVGMPAGVELMTDPMLTVVTITGPRGDADAEAS
jgi:large subunit ribosomal protein L25